MSKSNSKPTRWLLSILLPTALLFSTASVASSPKEEVKHLETAKKETKVYRAGRSVKSFRQSDIFTSVSLVPGFMNNALTIPDANSASTVQFYPEIRLAFAGKRVNVEGVVNGRFGNEVAFSFATSPNGTKSGILKLGVCHADYYYRNLTQKMRMEVTTSFGYMTAFKHNMKEPETGNALSANSHGLYFGGNWRLLIPVSQSFSMGIDFGITAFHLWNWRYKQPVTTPPLPSKRPGFGLYPSIGLTFNLGTTQAN